MHFYRFSDFADRNVYPDDERFFADLVAVYRDEIADLVHAGCRYIQLDEVAIALLCDPAIRAKVERAGADPDALVDLYIDAINRAVAGCPPTWSSASTCAAAISAAAISARAATSRSPRRFFAGTQVNHFLLEYDTPRAGDFGPLRFVPKGKGVVLGLISSKTPVLESID